MQNHSLTDKVVLITGAAQRVGAAMARSLHAEGMRVAIHYRGSRSDAERLAWDFNELRPESACTIEGDLTELDRVARIVTAVQERFDRLDALVNNASAFYPTPVAHASAAQWEELVAINMRAPFFLAQASAPMLKTTHGCIVNMVDIYAHRPLSDHPIYCATKAGLIALTRALARDLSPIRVNAVAPGAILWPSGLDDDTRRAIVERTPLKRAGRAEEIATAVVYLIRDATFVTGEVVTVDGGRSLTP